MEMPESIIERIKTALGYRSVSPAMHEGQRIHRDCTPPDDAKILSNHLVTTHMYE